MPTPSRQQHAAIHVGVASDNQGPSRLFSNCHQLQDTSSKATQPTRILGCLCARKRRVVEGVCMWRAIKRCGLWTSACRRRTHGGANQLASHLRLVIVINDGVKARFGCLAWAKRLLPSPQVGVFDMRSPGTAPRPPCGVSQTSSCPGILAICRPLNHIISGDSRCMF